MYNAEDLVFHVVDTDEDTKAVMLGNILPIDDEPFDDDNIGFHNVNERDLKNAGLMLVELYEGCFEFEDESISTKSAEKLMLKAGFKQNPEFDELIKTEYGS